MASAFDLMWVAFVFLFDVRIYGFDILPDVIGYILMTIGLKRLASINAHFASAARLAPVVALVSLADFYQPPVTGASILALGGPTFKTPIGALLTVAGIILVFLNLLLVYHMVAGIVEVAKSRRDKDVIEAATPLWGEYKALHILLMIVPLVAFVPAINWVAPLAQLAVGIVVYFTMIGFLRLAQWNLFGPTSKTSDQN